MTPLAAWQDCVISLSCGETPPLARGHALVARWEEPHRHYHTLGHLQSCLAWWQRMRGRLHAPAEAGLALLNHDAIYDPQRGDNEARSAELGCTDLTELGMSEGQIRNISSLIQATDHRSGSAHPDAAAVIDIDLAILGSDSAVYRRYVANVRLEYVHIDQAGWTSGSTKFLNHFLKRPLLYTSGLCDELDRRARQNLTDELTDLTTL